MTKEHDLLVYDHTDDTYIELLTYIVSKIQVLASHRISIMVDTGIDDTDELFKPYLQHRILEMYEERDLLSLYHKYDLAQEQKLIIRDFLLFHNFRLIRKIAFKFHKYAEMSDLIAQGTLGFMDALEKFNPNAGTKLSTYAVYWITQKIIRYINQNERTIRIPAHFLSDLSKLNIFIHKYELEHGHEPSDKEIISEFGYSLQKLHELRTLGQPVISYDSPLHSDKELTLLDLDIVPKDDTGLNDLLPEDEISLEQIQVALAELNPREKKILSLRFGLNGDEPTSLEQLASDCELSREGVRQIVIKALDKLRKKLNPLNEKRRTVAAGISKLHKEKNYRELTVEETNKIVKLELFMHNFNDYQNRDLTKVVAFTTEFTKLSDLQKTVLNHLYGLHNCEILTAEKIHSYSVVNKSVATIYTAKKTALLKLIDGLDESFFEAI